MVNKLLKHEVKYYIRTLFIYEIVLFTLAFFTRILMFFETDSIVYKLAQGSSFILFGFAVFACSLMATVISVFRFYKNLFTSEGYLTFALPVSSNQHLFAKLLSASVYNIIVFISCIAAFLITISGDLFNELVKASIYLLKFIGQQLPDVPLTLHIVLYIIEICVSMLVSTVLSLLLYYVCIAIGQTAKKNRILLAVAIYFGYMMLTEIFSTIISITMSITMNLPLFQKISTYIINHPFATLHISFCSTIVITTIMCVVFYVITNVIMKRKLNLE